MDKQTHRFVMLAVLGLIVLCTGACQQPPPEDNTPATPPPGRKAVRATPGGAGQAASPGAGTAATPGAPGKAPGKGPKGAAPAADQAGAKKGPKGGTPAQAKAGADPFAPRGAGAVPGRPGQPAGAAAAPDVPKILVYSGRRKDPFFVDWKLPVPPPYVFDEVEPIRLASDAIETPKTQPFEVREQPEMRVSGIMTGDGVFAILESGGDKVDVVKPGSSVEISVQGQTKRTYKVVSITKDKVKLRSQVDNVIYTQEVPLSDVGVGSAQRSGFSGGGGQSGMPGAMPGGSPLGGTNGPRGRRGAAQDLIK